MEEPIKRVPLKNRPMNTLFQSANGPLANTGITAETQREASTRQKAVAEAYNAMNKQVHGVDDLGIWEEARVPNRFNTKAQQALSPFMDLNKTVEAGGRQNVMFFDIEALGTPKHMQTGQNLDLFAMTELSFGGTEFNGKEFANKQKIVSMAIAPGKDEYQRLKTQLNQLKKNPLAAVSKDMHRSMLDLVKYSDSSHFENIADQYENAYRGIKDHATIPSADSGMTRNMIKKAEAGLENLMTGTSVEDAIRILQQNTEASNSILGGYNIHKYDIPALMGVATNPEQAAFFEKSMKDSLDFYHAYSAVEKDPYTSTGSTLRQEHIHQDLIKKGIIKPEEGKHYLYHLAADDIQANIEIAQVTTEKINEHIKENVGKNLDYQLSPDRISTKTLKQGDDVFSYQSGYRDKIKHKHNLVGRVVGGEEIDGIVTGGSIEPRWENLDTSLPSNERFKIGEFFQDTDLPDTDKKGFGVRLDSRDIKGKSIILMSETQLDLADQIHASFSPLDSETSKGLRDLKVRHDQATREYGRMFDEKGWSKMNQYYDFLDSADPSAEGFNWSNHIVSKGGSDELALKFPHMVPRLEEEKPIWDRTRSALNKSGLSDDQKTLALKNVKGNLDALGENKKEVFAPGSKFFDFDFGSESRVLNAKDSGSIKGSFRSFINGGMTGERVGVPEKAFRKQKITELETLITKQFNLTKDSKTGQKIRALSNAMIREVNSGGKIETALTSISNFVQDEVETKGRSSFVREVTDDVTDTRKIAIRGLSENLDDVLQDSITEATSYKRGSEILSGDTKLKGYLKEQDSRIRKLFEENFGMHGMNSDTNIGRASGKAAKFEDLVGEIVETYSHDFNTQIKMMDKGGGHEVPYMILSDKKTKLSTANINTLEELVTNPNISTIELPTLGEDLRVSLGSNKKVPLISSGIMKNDKTVFHSVSNVGGLQSILSDAKNVREIYEDSTLLGKKDAFIRIQQRITGGVSRKVNPVAATPNRRLSFDDMRMFDAPSALAGEVRSNRWDISGFAEQWYKDNYTRHEFGRTPEQVSEQARKRGVSFAQAMDQRAQGIAQGGELLDFAEGYLGQGLKGSAFGVNKSGASKYMVATARGDARTFMALGNYYADSVENPQKTVNYRKLDKEQAFNTLNQSDKAFGHRVDHSFISDAAHEVLSDADEWRGVGMFTSFVTDEQIAVKLNDADTMARYKDMIRKSDAPENMKRQMYAVLDMGMLSTDEGLSVMDYKLMEAFDGIDEVRITRDANQMTFKSPIDAAIEKQALEQGLGNHEWRDTGITLNEPVTLSQDEMKQLIGQDGKMTLGQYTAGGITQDLEELKQFRPGDTVSILGFDANDPNKKTLVMGRARKTGHGFKTITESGLRNTATPMLGEIISDISGVEGTEHLNAYLSSSKGMNHLGDHVRGIDARIREYHTDQAPEMLEELYSDVKELFDIDTERVDVGNKYLVSSAEGLDGKVMEYSNLETLNEKWNTTLGISSPTPMPVLSAHDVWTRQGSLENAKITTKEITQLQKGYRSIDARGEGIGDAHLGWLRDTVYGSGATPEMQVSQNAYKDTIKASLNYDKGQWQVKENDVVIDFTSETKPPVGSVNAEKIDGVLHMSKEAFEPVPQRSAHSQTYTLGDYQNTIIKAGDMDYITQNDGAGKIRDLVLKDDASIYMKLPEWAQQEHLPLIDVDTMSLPGQVSDVNKTEFLNEMKGHYAKISRNIDEHDATFILENMTDTEIGRVNASREALRSNTNTEIERFFGTLNASTSNESMSGLLSRRLEMSSQFQFGGINPLTAYEKQGTGWANTGMAQEGTVYMNRTDVGRMIHTSPENFAKAWDLDVSSVLPEDMTDFVLKNWNDNDTFASTIRYPSIDVGTDQAMKVKISDAVGEGQVVGLKGMAGRMAADHDGDNIAVLFSHYAEANDEIRSAVLEDLRKANHFDTSKNMLQLDQMMNKMEGEFKGNLAEIANLDIDSKDISAVSDALFSGEDISQLTLGDYEIEKSRSLIDTAMTSTGDHDTWGIAKNSYFDEAGQYTDMALTEHRKSLLANASATTIGSADNTRFRISAAYNSLSETRFDLFSEAEGALRYDRATHIRNTTMVDELLREYSQKAISAKKTEGTSMSNTEAMRGLFDRLDTFNSPEGVDFDAIASDLATDLYKKDKPFLNIGKGEIYQGTSEEFIKESIMKIADAQEVMGSAGMGDFRNPTLMAGNSAGIRFTDLADMTQTGKFIPSSDVLSYTQDIASDLGYQEMKEGMAAQKDRLRQVYEGRALNVRDRLEDGSSLLEMMNPPSSNPSLVMGSSSMPIHKTIQSEMKAPLEEMASGFKKGFGGSAGKIAGMGAAAFAGLWATRTLINGAPTPEGLQEMAPVAPETLSQPTARITPNDTGEMLNIQINARSAGRMDTNDIAAMVNNEIMAMSNMQMQTNINIRDNSKKINGKWVENAVANSMNKGYAY